MVISPSLHPMKALVVSNHGLPNIIGCPLEGSFDSTPMKSTGYSHEMEGLFVLELVLAKDGYVMESLEYPHRAK